MEIKVLVADDELPARGELKYQLASMPHVNVIGECANGKEVISFLETHPQVDLLFLDIEMPIMNGLEAAQKIIGMNHCENCLRYRLQPICAAGFPAGSFRLYSETL